MSLSTLPGHNPQRGEWNDSLRYDFLWSRVNFGEAFPDVITPFSWAVAKPFVDAMSLTPACPFGGNIGGRVYANLTFALSLYATLDHDLRRVAQHWAPLIGRIPEAIELKRYPLFQFATLPQVMRNLFQMALNMKRGANNIAAYLDRTPDWCRQQCAQIRAAQTQAALAGLWRETLQPYALHSIWTVMGAGSQSTVVAADLRAELVRLVGEAEANALLVNVGGGELASLGPLAGLAQVARGSLSRAAYLERYGHRGPHEMELSAPPPAEDSAYLERQLAEQARAPLDAEARLARQQADVAAAWERFAQRWPQRAPAMQRRLARMAQDLRRREATRSEMVRAFGVLRAFALRAGELTGLGDEVFFLYADEILEVLADNRASLAYLPVRRAQHAAYSALPPYPAVINGHFDPKAWAAAPNRQSDFFDAHAATSHESTSDCFTGFAGAAGCVEGRVRVLQSLAEGDQLQPGEVLVAVTTNVGWTLLFPRAAAVITDVGAPLSHAAIVARELGIPAVVGSGNATTRLHTGDRVRVDGGQGRVSILECQHHPIRPDS